MKRFMTVSIILSAIIAVVTYSHTSSCAFSVTMPLVPIGISYDGKELTLTNNACIGAGPTVCARGLYKGGLHPGGIPRGYRRTDNKDAPDLGAFETSIPLTWRNANCAQIEAASSLNEHVCAPGQSQNELVYGQVGRVEDGKLLPIVLGFESAVRSNPAKKNYQRKHLEDAKNYSWVESIVYWEYTYTRANSQLHTFALYWQAGKAGYVVQATARSIDWDKMVDIFNVALITATPMADPSPECPGNG
jgi:hypothetical protein